MNLSHDALRDLTTLAQLKSEGGILERQFLQLKEHVIKGHLVGTSSLEGIHMSLQLRRIGGISEEEHAADVDGKIAEILNNSDCVEVVGAQRKGHAFSDTEAGVRAAQPRDPKYGRFQLNERFNSDQVPLPFVNGQSETWVLKGSKRVSIAQPFSDLEKRKCTIQPTIGPGGELIRCAIIFRGTGKRISKVGVKGPRLSRGRCFPEKRVGGQRLLHGVGRNVLSQEY